MRDPAPPPPTLTRRLRPPAAAVRAVHCASLMLLALFALTPDVPARISDHETDRAAAPSIARFRTEMPKTIRADHPAILPVAAAIRTLTQAPLEQLVVVNDVAHLLVDYDDDERVYGETERHATLDEMLAQRRAHGWLYLRDDCDGRAVFAAHLLAALGIPWRLEASHWKQHAWVVARVSGVDYDLLDLRADVPELRRLSYQVVGRLFTRSSRRPPPFDWRRRWAAHPDFETGLRLGLLALDSTPAYPRERYSTDWVKQFPAGRRTPYDPRTRDATYAGFPYGEPLLLAAAPGATGPSPTGPILAARPAPDQPVASAQTGVAEPATRP